MFFRDCMCKEIWDLKYFFLAEIAKHKSYKIPIFENHTFCVVNHSNVCVYWHILNNFRQNDFSKNLFSKHKVKVVTSAATRSKWASSHLYGDHVLLWEEVGAELCDFLVHIDEKIRIWIVECAGRTRAQNLKNSTQTCHQFLVHRSFVVTKRSHRELVCSVVASLEYQLNNLSVACVLRFVRDFRDMFLEIESNCIQTTQECHFLRVVLRCTACECTFAPIFFVHDWFRHNPVTHTGKKMALQNHWHTPKVHKSRVSYWEYTTKERNVKNYPQIKSAFLLVLLESIISSEKFSWLVW